MGTEEQAPVSNVERIVAFMAIGIGVVAFLCLIAVLMAPLLGVPAASLTAPGWQVAFLVAYFGLPLAVLLLIGLVIARIVQNRRHRARD
ncbi:hypothetical protein GCM10011490_11490 [Pseudoclavibacter endophyticus]|uniref:Multidrug ABC transporter ATPase n=1 Tax=Pseudoclavibacter endophyticus TaxID=1778590 RepID=A0A6H9WKT7_9MICO|nr:hypothetical protein [Pseudoclavibacter endophyticus]KAB1649426.1 hypothetical protein F8O04_03945 [Pseudoclavibacter endophyticus]GGA62739.1 hypothetical protein GCM10011490_11490 [Pseudoclavibacter endophyticus]